MIRTSRTTKTMTMTWDEDKNDGDNKEEADKPCRHRETTTAYETGDLIITAPSTGNSEDNLLFLFLNRTDALLPLEVPGWTRVAGCFKSEDDQPRCHTADCRRESSRGVLLTDAKWKWTGFSVCRFLQRGCRRRIGHGMGGGHVRFTSCVGDCICFWWTEMIPTVVAMIESIRLLGAMAQQELCYY